MKTSKNKKMKMSNGNFQGNDISSQTFGQGDSQESNPNPVANRNYGNFDFGIDQEFIQENNSQINYKKLKTYRGNSYKHVLNLEN